MAVDQAVQFILNRGIGPPTFDFRSSPSPLVDFLFHLSLMIVVVRQNCMHLSASQVRVLPADFLGIPMVCQVILDNFDDFRRRASDEGHAVGIDIDVRVYNRTHCRCPCGKD